MRRHLRLTGAPDLGQGLRPKSPELQSGRSFNCVLGITSCSTPPGLKSRARLFAVICTSTAVLFFLPAAQAQEANRPAEDISGSGAELVKEGNKLLAEGKYEDALAAYDKAAGELPDSPVVAYNQGLALYRLGRFDKAERVMQDALKSGNPELEAKTKYNLGRCAHESAITKKDDLKGAVNDVSRAVRFYQDALQLAPDDADARKNLDQAERLRAFLEKKLEEQKQQPPCSQPSSQPSSQPDQQPTSQPSSQPASQPQEGQQAQQQQGEEGQEEQGDQHQEDKEQGEKRGKARQGKKGEEGERQDAEEEAGEQGEDEEKESDEMKAAEVEPMLQEARDAERQRREAKRLQAIRIRGKIKPDKDW